MKYLLMLFFVFLPINTVFAEECRPVFENEPEPEKIKWYGKSSEKYEINSKNIWTIPFTTSKKNQFGSVSLSHDKKGDYNLGMWISNCRFQRELSSEEFGKCLVQGKDKVELSFSTSGKKSRRCLLPKNKSFWLHFVSAPCNDGDACMATLKTAIKTGT